MTLLETTDATKNTNMKTLSFRTRQDNTLIRMIPATELGGWLRPPPSSQKTRFYYGNSYGINGELLEKLPTRKEQH